MNSFEPLGIINKQLIACCLNTGDKPTNLYSLEGKNFPNQSDNLNIMLLQ